MTTNDRIVPRLDQLDCSFDGLLRRAGISKAELARRFDIKAPSVSRWRSDPPRYATAYLELLIECNRWRP